jgi:hypothetical protein
MARRDDFAVRGAASPVVVDRILMGVCAAVWLLLLGVSVAAIVALVDLGRGHPEVAEGSEGSSTPWLLYGVIGASALIILGAIPLLLRARRMGMTEPQPGTRPTGGPVRAPDAPLTPPIRRETPAPTRTETATEKLRRFGSLADPWDRYQPDFVQSTPSRRGEPWIPETALDRLWLRCTVVIVGAMGAALVAVAVATHLMAVDRNGLAWACYAVAAVIAVLMPLIPWWYLRQLRAVIGELPAAAAAEPSG